ncbi:MAG: AAA family ATPase [Chloroflexota bacterium]
MADQLIPHFILEQYKDGYQSSTLQAATLFVDLAGFTQMTAALMWHQKDGVEVLAEALDSVFSPLVREVYQRGGMIPLFAGDGFTAIFPIVEDPSNPHSSIPSMRAAHQAVECAEAIQRELEHKGPMVSTRYGHFHLAAKVGLSYGEVRWGIPGKDGLRCFYFRGEAVNNCAKAEHEAQDGEIVADAHILAVLGPRIRSVPLSANNYYRITAIQERVRVPYSVAIPPRPSRAELAPFISQAVLNMTQQADFRDVCVIFLSFQEPPPDIALSETDTHTFLGAVIDLTEQCGGMVNQLDFGDMGGYFLLLFGAPIAHGDDVNRAAEFLLCLREQGWMLPWRAGVAYGTAWAGRRGGKERMEYGVTGNVVNLACRLFLMAPWDEIWVDAAVHEQLHSSHFFDALGPKKIRGREGDQPVYRLLKENQEATETSLYVSGLVERHSELERLGAWVQPIFANQSAGLFLVHGEAGIGKSHLVREFQRQLGETEVLWIKCVADSTERRPYGPFRYALRRYFRERTDQPLVRDAQYNRALFHLALDNLIEAIAGIGRQGGALIDELDRTSSCLAALLDIRWPGSYFESLPAQSQYYAIMTAFQTFIKALALFQPVILRLDNIHWFDDESLAMLGGLAHHINGSSVAILGTTRYRRNGTPIQLRLDQETPSKEINLSYLSFKGIEQVAAQVIQGEPMPELVAFLAEQTGGNPFFVQQLALDLWERGVIYAQQVGDYVRYGLRKIDSTMPSSISAVLLSRLDRLEPSVKKVVQVGAVLGREFDTAILAALLVDDPNLHRKVKSAQLAGIWRAESDGNRYRFEHALLHDAAYDMQIRAMLRSTHRQVAQTIEKLYRADLAPYYGQLAHHYDQAEEFHLAESWRQKMIAQTPQILPTTQPQPHSSRPIHRNLAHPDHLSVPTGQSPKGVDAHRRQKTMA